MQFACTQCGAISSKSLCPRHRSAGQKSRRGSWGGSTREWRKIRERILKRDPFCQVRLRCDGSAPSTTVDHIVPKSKGGDDSDGNLRGSCQRCNLARGNRTRSNSVTTVSRSAPRTSARSIPLA